MTHRTGRNRRSGFTLVEVVTILAGMAVLLGMGGALVHVLLRADRSARELLADSASTARLGERFRQDAHEATEAEATADGAGLTFHRPDKSQVEYRVDGRTLVVSRPVPGEATTGREAYRPRDGTPALAVEEVAGRTFAVLTIAADEAVRGVRIEATVGARSPAPDAEAQP